MQFTLSAEGIPKQIEDEIGTQVKRLIKQFPESSVALHSIRDEIYRDVRKFGPDDKVTVAVNVDLGVIATPTAVTVKSTELPPGEPFKGEVVERQPPASF